MNNKQRKILKSIFANPVSPSIPWKDIEKLLIAVGCDFSEGRGSRVRFKKNGIFAIFHRPHPKKETDKGKFIHIFAMEEKLKFSQFQGEARGEAIRRFKESFINEFGKDSSCRPEILKGKHPQRILWAILTTDNLEKVNSWINSFE